MIIQERNRNNIISRWDKIHRIERGKIIHDSKHKSRICGFLAGDGNILMNGRYWLRLFPDDESLISPLLDSFSKVYDKKLTIKDHGKFYTLSLHSKVVCEDLNNYCKFGTYCWNIPFNLFESDKDVSEWLKSFFDAEAYVNLNSKCIKVSSVNQNGLNEIRSVLKRKFKIDSVIYSYVPKNVNHSKTYLLHIFGVKNLSKYFQKIGFNHKIKLSKLYKLL